MIITYFGEGGFRLQSGDLSLLVDPPNNRLKADILLETESDPAAFSSQAGEICFPGEYEIKEVEIVGRLAAKESSDKVLKTVYAIRFEDVKFGFLGRIKETPPAEVLEIIDDVDILFVPVDGKFGLDPKEAASLVKQIEPKVVIPNGEGNVKEFAKALGQDPVSQEKFVFKRKELETYKGAVLVLKNLSN